ncbi:MAG: PKD domain-containing protein [Crocinitomix sp.]|nr:PKD domain-containing protein [Crocinitomix sp.]
MKFIVTALFLSLFATGFGQGALIESGTWCDGDLEVAIPASDESTVLGWYKDGVLLEGETEHHINCMTYGKGFYMLKISIADTEYSYLRDLTTVAGPSADFTAKNMLAAAVTYFDDSSISTEEITAWHWDFGNGETSTEQNPKVMFAEQKVYTITLKVTTTSGCTHTITKKHEWAYK